MNSANDTDIPKAFTQPFAGKDRPLSDYPQIFKKNCIMRKLQSLSELYAAWREFAAKSWREQGQLLEERAPPGDPELAEMHARALARIGQKRREDERTAREIAGAPASELSVKLMLQALEREMGLFDAQY